MVKIALLIEYEGTNYCGFQIQKNLPTIQGELEKAILRGTGNAVRVHGAGRTDAGVHASGQVATFGTESALPVATVVKAVNFYLPDDIAVKDACEVEAGFDARRDALSREYRYTILNNPMPLPLSRRLAYLVPGKLNIDRMNKACEALIGEHAFASFTNSEGGSKNTVRTLFEAKVDKEGDFIFFDVRGNAFLPHQVRRTVGCLVKIGLGKMQISDFQSMLVLPRTGTAQPAAPPHGLCLQKVNYSEIGFRK